MKKTIVITFIITFSGTIIMLLLGHHFFMPISPHKLSPVENHASTTQTQSSIQFDSGIWDNKTWSNYYATYSGDIIPTAEVAVNIASDILYSIEWGGTPDTCSPCSVFLDVEDNIWIVYFSPIDQADSDMQVLGGGYYVALQKSDGKILCIFGDQ